RAVPSSARPVGAVGGTVLRWRGRTVLRQFLPGLVSRAGADGLPGVGADGGGLPGAPVGGSAGAAVGPWLLGAASGAGAWGPGAALPACRADSRLPERRGIALGDSLCHVVVVARPGDLVQLHQPPRCSGTAREQPVAAGRARPRFGTGHLCG